MRVGFVSALFICLFIDVLKYILYVHKNAFWMDGLITST